MAENWQKAKFRNKSTALISWALADRFMEDWAQEEVWRISLDAVAIISLAILKSQGTSNNCHSSQEISSQRLSLAPASQYRG